MALTTSVAITVGATAAEACSCMPGLHPCTKVNSARVIFRAEVIAANREGARLRVLEVFAGKPAGIVEFAHSRNTCDIRFERGREYLVYADHYSGVLRTSICAGTTTVPHASEDLEFLRDRASRHPGRGLITGVVAGIDGEPVAGVRVTARRGSDVQSVLTNDAGTFLFEAVPGTYFLSAAAPNGDAARVRPEWIGIGRELHCSVPSVDLITSTTRINGRVVDWRGRPVPHLRVDLIPPGRSMDHFGLTDDGVRTDTNGAFEITNLPLGLYAIGVQLPRQSRLGVDTIYAPGVTESAYAELVHVVAKASVHKTTIRLPQSVRVATISGQVVDANGQPVAGAAVHSTGPEVSDSVFADAQGRFRLVGAVGKTYRLWARGIGLQQGHAEHALQSLTARPTPIKLVLVPLRLP